jgi:hypothetical protein
VSATLEDRAAGRWFATGSGRVMNHVHFAAALMEPVSSKSPSTPGSHQSLRQRQRLTSHLGLMLNGLHDLLVGPRD